VRVKKIGILVATLSALPIPLYFLKVSPWICWGIQGVTLILVLLLLFRESLKKRQKLETTLIENQAEHENDLGSSNFADRDWYLPTTKVLVEEAACPHCGQTLPLKQETHHTRV
jgi:hypothetical protein